MNEHTYVLLLELCHYYNYCITSVFIIPFHINFCILSLSFHMYRLLVFLFYFIGLLLIYISFNSNCNVLFVVLA